MSATVQHVTPHAARSAECRGGAGGVPWSGHLVLRKRGLGIAGLAGAALVVVYVVVLALANSLAHVAGELVRLGPWLSVLVLGFAAQMGLFSYARGAAQERRLPSAGVVGSSVTSTASMLACCAHHLTDVLPLAGLASAALFLAHYQRVFLVLGVGSNLTALTYLLAHMKKHRLFPERSSLLGTALRLPWAGAVPVVAVLALGWLSIAIFAATHR
jgi:hypothetical protein